MISIVIPVYNTEQYLTNCIESVIRQTYKDFECIIVDDGSTDNSLLICKDYESRDKRIRVYHKENGGLSSARNYGIERAKGEFLYFVDSDDELFEDALSVLNENMKEGIDLVFGGFVRCSEDGTIQYSTKGDEIFTTTAKGALDLVAYPSKYYQTLGMAWLNLFKRSIIMKYGLRYGELYGAVEDRAFLVSYICVCKGLVGFTTHPIYMYYYDRSGSIMNTRFQGFKQNTLNTLDGRIAVLKTVRSFKKSPKIIYEATLAVYYTYLELRLYVRQFNRSELELELRRKVKSVLSPIVFVFCEVRDRIKKFIF